MTRDQLILTHNPTYILGRIVVLLILFHLIVISCQSEPDEEVFVEEKLASIAEYLEQNKESYSKFYRIVVVGKLMDPMSAYNPGGEGFTLFLPTDEAFDRYIQNNPAFQSFDELMQDTNLVITLGRYHLVNIALHSNEFPYGALPNTNATGDLLTIGFSTNLDSMVTLVNDVAPVIEFNLKMENGYIHIISEVLQPVIISGFEWLEQNSEYSILAQSLEITGLKNKLGVNKKYTILAEHDSIYSRYGINSIDDLIDTFATPGLPYAEWDNSLYQFAAYHVLKGDYFLLDFEWGSKKYKTYADDRVQIDAGFEFRINPGLDTFCLDISESGDTTVINYIRLFWEESNILTKTGPIHLISEVMYFYKPPVPQQTDMID